MKGTSKVIMGATLVMVVSLALVLGLILVLLAELYCSLLFRRRQLRITTNTTAVTDPATTETPSVDSTLQPQDQSSHPPPPPTTPPLSSFHSQGVLKAPRSLLFPAISIKDESNTLQTKIQLSQLHHKVIDIPKCEPNSSPSPSISLAVSPKPTQEDKTVSGNGTTCTTTDACNDKGSGVVREHFVYISNPIYDNGESRESGVNTPFETPDTSPSRLEMSGSDSSSGEEDEVAQPLHSSPLTPPLTPMKKLPAAACSVSLRDARSLGTSGSDSNSNNGRSSSSSGSPCTSPSW
ncbi:uncharacterized protein LOC133797023 [Humulus lupulus]|uniref:uncharacterized protein LOC133797023 n=1 Tax=Humulus lupulus TaxID=3486 RepID=UPI002B408091|nr:uncharacterized protein LOC133797023 [Humulus lupulus]